MQVSTTAMYRRRGGRGVRGFYDRPAFWGVDGNAYPMGFYEGLGASPNIVHSLPTSRRFGLSHGINGLASLGAMPTLTGPQYAALTPAQQQAYGNGDPNFMSAVSATGPSVSPSIAYPAGSPITLPSPANFLPAATHTTASNPTFSTQTTPGTSLTTTTFDLNSYMANWAAEAAAEPASMGGGSPAATALGVAQSYCAAEGVSGCANLNSIAAQYGNQVQAALTAAGWTPQTLAMTTSPANPITNPATTQNTIQRHAPTQPMSPAAQVAMPGNAISPYGNTAYSNAYYATQTATGGTMLNPANQITSATASGAQLPAGYCFDQNNNIIQCPQGAATGTQVQVSTDNTWIWVVAIGAAGVLLLMWSQGGKA